MSVPNANHPKPALFGCLGPRLTIEERAFFRDSDPFAFILFKRNIEDPDQLRGLIVELRQTVGREAPIAIDQEGGRVARLKPPYWQKYPPARSFGMMYERDAAWGLEAIRLYSRILAHDLVKLGITINCAPVVDLFDPTASPVIGDRALSERPTVVAALARAQAETFLANGILPVIKHLPGHGKMKSDPHDELPTIQIPRAELETQDFVPFELLKDMPLGMNSHAIFTALDPAQPASLSSVVTHEIIRGLMGFDGLLIVDDLTMKALSGSMRALTSQALEAGNDIIMHCDGTMAQMIEIADALPAMSEASWARWTHARAMATPMNPAYHPAEDSARLDILLGGLAYGAA